MSEQPRPNPAESEVLQSIAEQEHLARVNKVFEAAHEAVQSNEEVPKLQKALSPQDAAAHRDALDYLKIVQHVEGDTLLPDAVKLPRNWSNSKKLQQWEQEDHTATVINHLEAVVTDNDRLTEEGVEKEAYDKRVAAHNKRIAEREAEKADRDNLREHYISYTVKRRSLRGVDTKPEDEEAIARDADRYVEEQLGAAQHTYGILDTDKLADQSEAKTVELHEENDEDESANNSADRNEPVANNEDGEEARQDAELYDELLLDFEETRNEYARRSAGRSRRIFRFGKEFSDEAVAEAREDYEKAQLELLKHELKVAQETGLLEELEEDKDRFIAATVAENNWSLTNAIYDYRLVASGRAKFNENGEVVPVEPKTFVGKGMNKLADWWGRQTNTVIKFRGKEVEVRGSATAKKALAMGGASAVLGAATAFSGGMFLGPVLGAAGVPIANRFVKTMAVSKLSHRVKGKAGTEGLLGNLKQEIMSDTPAMNGKRFTFSDAVDRRTNEEVKKNRKDMAIAVGSAALGGLAGAAIGEHVFGFGHGGGAHTTGSHVHHTPAHHHNVHHKPQAAVHKVTAGQVNSEYVANVYENAEGLHPGFTEMLQAAHRAMEQGLIAKVQPDPSNPNDFWYQVTKKGAKKFAKGAAGSSGTVDVMKVLSHFGNVKLKS